MKDSPEKQNWSRSVKNAIRKRNKKKKQTKTDPVNVKEEKPAEEQVMNSFPPIDQQSTSTTTLEEAAVPDTATKKEASSDASKEFLKVLVRLFSCDGCGRSYPTLMNLKRSCKRGSNQQIKLIL